MEVVEAFFKVTNELLDWEISVSFFLVNPVVVDVKVL